MRAISRVLFSALAGLCLVVSAAAETSKVQLSFADGRVTLVTQNATPAEIMREWARVSGAKVVNAEGLTGGPITLTLQGVSEREALDAVLRNAAGYMVAERDTVAPTASLYDRILIMPTSSAPPAAAPPVRASGPQPTPAVRPPFPQPAVGTEVEQAMAAEQEEADDVGAPEAPVVAPTATNFDYANPQKYFEMRAQQMQQGSAGNPPAPGAVFVPTATAGAGGGAAVAVVGGTSRTDTSTSPVPTAPQTTPTPGVTPTPVTPNGPAGTGQPNPRNPYGLPDGVIPGSQAAPNVEPDRGKYFNPYLPTPQTQPTPPQKPPDK